MKKKRQISSGISWRVLVRAGMLVCCLAGGQLFGQGVSASLRLSKPEILIGDQVVLRLSVSAPSGTPLAIRTDELIRAEGLEFLSRSAVDTVAREPLLLLEQRFVITAFEAGQYRIPPVLVVAGQSDSIRTNELTIKTNSLPVESDAKLEPIKDIIPEKINWQDFLPYILLALALVAIGIGLVRYLGRKKPTKAVVVPVLLPHELALQKLLALAQTSAEGPERLKAFYSELTYLLREYLENRFQWPALESTTREIERELAAHFSEQSWHTQLSPLLRNADLIKFAKASPAVDPQADLLLVRRFIEATVPPPPPEPSHKNEQKP